MRTRSWWVSGCCNRAKRQLWATACELSSKRRRDLDGGDRIYDGWMETQGGNVQSSEESNNGITRRAFGGAAAAAFMIVPRHVLGGQGYTAPSDKITIASIGLGRQGMAITMELLSRPDVHVTAVCDCNREGRNYIEYSKNALLHAERKLLGSGYEDWGADLASTGDKALNQTSHESMGAGGREPARRVVEAYYASRRDGNYKGCAVFSDFR